MKTELKNDVMIITLDDGKANVVGHSLLDELLPALDQAEKEAKAILIFGRAGIFSAGFDLKELQKTEPTIKNKNIYDKNYNTAMPAIAQADYLTGARDVANIIQQPEGRNV